MSYIPLGPADPIRFPQFPRHDLRDSKLHLRGLGELTSLQKELCFAAAPKTAACRDLFQNPVSLPIRWFEGIKLVVTEGTSGTGKKSTRGRINHAVLEENNQCNRRHLNIMRLHLPTFSENKHEFHHCLQELNESKQF